MTGVLLDIGAGSTNFARTFRKLNKDTYHLTYLCGEPSWKQCWDESIKENRITKVHASYQDLNVPDASLHFLTLNGVHAMIALGVLGPVAEEAARVLVPGGLFISAHPIGMHPSVSLEHFYEVVFPGESRKAQNARRSLGFRFYGGPVPVCAFDLWDYPPIFYPASKTIRYRFRMSSRGCKPCGYIYEERDPPPSVRVWVRNERPVR